MDHFSKMKLSSLAHLEEDDFSKMKFDKTLFGLLLLFLLRLDFGLGERGSLIGLDLGGGRCFLG